MLRLKQALSVGILASALAPAIAAHAATYYVATTGNNSNPGTEDRPWRTIGKAVNTMVAGDITYVRGGTYNTETGIRFRRSGTAAAPIKLLNYPGESPVIDWGTPDSTDIIWVWHSSGINVAIGYITIEGFEIKNGWVGIKFQSMHNSIIRRNWIHDNLTQGILGGGGHHNIFDRNIISHNGDFAACAAYGSTCSLQHGLYAHGDSYIVTNNLIYDNLSYGIVHNGSPSSVYSSSKHPSPAFAGAANWVIANNTIAYNHNRSAIVVWGQYTTNTRIENNIFYRNTRFTAGTNGVTFTSATGATGIKIDNNHFYATVSGSTAATSAGAPTSGYSFTNNVVNVSSPAFVDAGETVPASPNFTLTAQSPAIDAGVSLTETKIDFTGTPRPQGRAPDIGAYEYRADGDSRAPAPVQTLKIQ